MEDNNTNTPKAKTVMEFLKSKGFLRPFLGVLLGAAGGFLYYYFIGCNTGTCPITSSPYGSVITGGLLGFLVTGSPCANSKQC